MAPSLLKEFVLPISSDAFLDAFWLDSAWYEKFLKEKLKDIDITIEHWAEDEKNPSVKQRKIRSFHPANISFPGLPSHAESMKMQSLELCYRNDDQTKTIIKETNALIGIPYADYFTVHTEWVVLGQNERSESLVYVYLEVKFLKYTWLQGTIESTTKAEMLQIIDAWMESAHHYIRQQPCSIHKGYQVPDLDKGAIEAIARSPPPEQEDDTVSIHSRHSGQNVFVVGEEEAEGDSGVEEDRSTSDFSVYISDEDDSLFYDCEDGEKALLMQRTTSHESVSSLGEMLGGSSKSRKNKRLGSRSGHDLAVRIVETVFVLSQFSFWQLHQFYVYDLKELFRVDPDEVFKRILCSFLPGWHASLLGSPDIYGPLVAVALLPQTLLLSLEPSRHGCSPTSQLGNAVVVCLVVWLGLAALYRLLALVVAPALGVKQCLSLLGYSFYSWNLALLLLLPIERLFVGSLEASWYSDMGMGGGAEGIKGGVVNTTALALGIHQSDNFHHHHHSGSSSTLAMLAAFLPLIVVGLPCSLAQGYVFWEHTPASSLTLQPTALPVSIQPFATQHSRCLQRLLWAGPKILAFVVVAGTHYQLLWYMARVFLPGRRQLCRLSALMQPSQYADILTQKELRLFALKLLSGRRLDES
eukprot:gene6813-7526_t